MMAPRNVSAYLLNKNSCENQQEAEFWWLLHLQHYMQTHIYLKQFITWNSLFTYPNILVSSLR